MTVSRETLHSLIERLPDDELNAAQRYLEFLSQEPIGRTFADSIRRGIVEAGTGQTVVCRTYDEMVEKLLGPE